MSHLGEENPDVLVYLRSGGFSVQIGSMNTFGRIPVNETCQETELETLKHMVAQRGSA